MVEYHMGDAMYRHFLFLIVLDAGKDGVNKNWFL